MRRALIIYLAGYYLLVAGAVVTLWRSGVLQHLDRGWTVVTLAVAVALGATLWLTSQK